MSAVAKEALWTRPFSLTVLGSLFLFIPYSLYLPILPTYLLKELHSSLAAAGAVNAVFLLASVLFRVQTAWLEARFGTRRVLLTSGFLFMVTNGLYLLVSTTATIMLIRFLSGICFAVANTAIAALGSRLAPLSRKGEGMAYLTAAVTVGGAIGPITGLSLSVTYGFDAVFIFCALITLLGVVISCGIAIPDGKSAYVGHYSLHELFEAKAVPVSVIILVLSFAYAGVLTFVTIYAGELNLHFVAAYFFVVMAVFSVVPRIVTGRFYDRFGPNASIYPAIVMMGAGLLTLGSVHTTTGMLAAAALLGLGYGMAVPSIQTLAIQLSPVHRISIVTATFFTCLDIGTGLGAYLLGAGIQRLGYADVYLMLGVLALCCSLLYYAVFTRKHMN